MRGGAVHRRLTLRSLIMATAGCLLVFGGYMTQHLSMSALPYLLFIVGAAWLPEGPPPTLASAVVASALSVVQASIYAGLGFDRWHMGTGAQGESAFAGCRAGDPNVHKARACISFVWAAAFLWLAADVLRRHCEGFWTALRLVIGICSGLRLGVNVLLHALDAPSDCFVPGGTDFKRAFVFNLSCVVLATVVLSSRCRHQLSKWTGGALVVLTLAEIQGDPTDGDPPSQFLEDMRSTHSHSQPSRVDSPHAAISSPHGECVPREAYSARSGTLSHRSAGSSAGPELGQLWTETPAVPADERLGTAVFYESDSDDSAFDQRPPPPTM